MERLQVMDLLKTETKCLKETLYREFELSKVSGEVHLILEVLNKFTSPVFFLFWFGLLLYGF